MAITFARLQPMRLTSGSGAARVMAYTARTAIRDPRFAMAFDYSGLSGDLVHEEILLPDGYPPELQDRGLLARALDGAELKRVRTPLNERIRKPQVGLGLVIALPRDGEITVDEAIELTRRILIAARGSFNIPIHFAIHDDAILTPGDVNRHAHGLFGLRVFRSAGEAGPRLRDVMARHRVGAHRSGAPDIVEGIDWPFLVWELQQLLFCELGIDLVVDPIAPHPGEHYSPIHYSNGTIHTDESKKRITATREAAHALNVEAIAGSPCQLINKLLRGRSTLRIDEPRRLCAKFIDHESDREAYVERLLADQNVITLADSAASARPRYVTTRLDHRLFSRAAEVIESVRDIEIKAVTAVDHASVVAQITGLCDPLPTMSDPPMILGRSLSDCDETAKALAFMRPVVGTIAMAITGPSWLRKRGRSRGLRLGQGRLVIIPRSELVDDRDLARVLLAVNQSTSLLVLGHDQSRKTGVVCRRLAVFAADQLARNPVEPGRNPDHVAIERLLRCGLVRLAVEAIAEHGHLRFTTETDHDANVSSTFVVCDDPGRIGEVAERVRDCRVMAGTMSPPVRLERIRDSINLSVGEWIVTTQTKYTEPRLYAGRIGQIVNIDESRNTLEIVTEHGDRRTIDPRDYPWIRSAAAISIREARNADPDIRLSIQLTDYLRAWSALLLAAGHGANAQLNIDPKIARTPAELVNIVQRSLPGALPHQLIRRRDPEAEIAKVISSIRKELPELEIFPDITPTEVRIPQPINVAERARHVLKSDRDAKLGYQLLFRHVSRDNPDHQTNIERILPLCSSDLTREIVRLLADLPDTPSRQVSEVDDLIDLPPEMAGHTPRQWSELDISNFTRDLRTMSHPSSLWNIAPRSPASVIGGVSRIGRTGSALVGRRTK